MLINTCAEQRLVHCTACSYPKQLIITGGMQDKKIDFGCPNKLSVFSMAGKQYRPQEKEHCEV